MTPAPDHLGDADERQAAIYRGMTPTQRLQQAVRMNQQMRSLWMPACAPNTPPGLSSNAAARSPAAFSMHGLDELSIFIRGFERLDAPYMVTGVVPQNTQPISVPCSR